jgi:hypothetical protein
MARANGLVRRFQPFAQAPSAPIRSTQLDHLLRLVRDRSLRQPSTDACLVTIYACRMSYDGNFVAQIKKQSWAVYLIVPVRVAVWVIA